jgi:site-specific DNA-methyltransferase (adenine-specific)
MVSKHINSLLTNFSTDLTELIVKEFKLDSKQVQTVINDYFVVNNKNVVSPFENHIFEGDCISLSKKYLSDNSVDLIITDPPYGIAGHTLDKHYNRDEKNVIKGYTDIDSKDYAKFSKDWIKEATRVLRPGRRMFIVSGWSHLVDILDAIQLCELTIINHIIWKFNFGVYTTRKFVSSHYHILFVQKGISNLLLNPIIDNIWYIKREYKRGQIKNKNQLPSELLKRMISIGSKPDELVVDFFMGSGSTGVESIKMGRRTIGFEINPEACAFAIDNLQKAVNSVILECNKNVIPEYDKNVISKCDKNVIPECNTNVISNCDKNVIENSSEINVNCVDLVISQIFVNSKTECIKIIQKAISITRKGGSMFFIVSSENLLTVLQTLYSINGITEINHIIWSWNNSKIHSSHSHVLFFSKNGKERTFNRVCRFSEKDRTQTGGSACYADMEDVWNFNEIFDNSLPVVSIPLVQKIVQYCSNPNDIVVDIISQNTYSNVYNAIMLMKEPRKCFVIKM